MTNNAHDLQLTILYSRQRRSICCILSYAYLEPLVLQHTLDSSIFTRRRELSLENHSEGTISHDLALGVLHIASLPSHSILDLLTNDLYELTLADVAETQTLRSDLTSHPQAGESCGPVL